MKEPRQAEPDSVPEGIQPVTGPPHAQKALGFTSTAGMQTKAGGGLISVKTNPCGGTGLVFLEHPAQEIAKKSTECRPAD